MTVGGGYRVPFDKEANAPSYIKFVAANARINSFAVFYSIQHNTHYRRLPTSPREHDVQAHSHSHGRIGFGDGSG
jgi:hypothetical protein